MTEPLYEFERAALFALLAGDHRLLTTLREQAAVALCDRRERSGSGVFTHLRVPPDCPIAATATARFWLGGVHAEIPGVDGGAGIALLVDGGRISMLEAFVFVGAWPAAIHEFVLSISCTDRGLEALGPG